MNCLSTVVNVTMPDDKQNYIHRIGRVGRADRMGLAVSLVATEKEKVWYHSCPSKGKSCYNAELKEYGGCAIWYDEKQVGLGLYVAHVCVHACVRALANACAYSSICRHFISFHFVSPL